MHAALEPPRWSHVYGDLWYLQRGETGRPLAMVWRHLDGRWLASWFAADVVDFVERATAMRAACDAIGLRPCPIP